MTITKQAGMLLALAGLLTGAFVTIGLQSHAQTDITTADVRQAQVTQAPDQQPDKQFDSFSTKSGHKGANGVQEQLLTGDTAAQVTAAALQAVPGGTIQRVETDAEGAVYEAHMLKADGTPVTVKFDANYGVTATEDGPMHMKQMNPTAQPSAI